MCSVMVSGSLGFQVVQQEETGRDAYVLVRFEDMDLKLSNICTVAGTVAQC